MFATVLGTVIVVRDEQLLNAYAPISVKLFGSSISSRFSHPLKAFEPILSTSAPIVMVSNKLQVEKALFPIYVTPASTTTFVTGILVPPQGALVLIFQPSA